MSTQRRIQNSDLRLVRPMRQTHPAHQAQSEILADVPRQATEHRHFLHANSEREAINAVSGMHLFLFLSDSIELSEFNSFCIYYN